MCNRLHFEKINETISTCVSLFVVSHNVNMPTQFKHLHKIVHFFFYYLASMRENLTSGLVNNKGADLRAHLHRPIIAFLSLFLEIIISKLVIF